MEDSWKFVFGALLRVLVALYYYFGFAVVVVGGVSFCVVVGVVVVF